MSELPDKLGALRDIARVLSDLGVSYALMGGVAVGIHSGVPRATLDVDIAIPTQADQSQIIKTLAAAGFDLVGQFAHSINFRHSSGEPVQLAFDLAFDPMIARAEVLEIGDERIFVVTKADLIEMKRRAAADPSRRRSKALRDQADILMLEGDVPDPNEGW